MSIETHLDNVFSSAAHNRLKNSKDKIYNYTLLSEDFSKKEKSGKAIMTHCHYDRFVDCDMVTVKDIDTDKNITANTFRLILREIKE